MALNGWNVVDAIERVQEEVANAAMRSGRSAEDVTIVAVSKGSDIRLMQALLDAGYRDMGENRVKELTLKAAKLVPEVRWHFIGQIQTNKIKELVTVPSLIHSVDRYEVALQLSKRASSSVDVLVEANVSGEQSKGGVSGPALEEFVGRLLELDKINLMGLMTIAPLTSDPEASRGVFARLAGLIHDLAGAFPYANIHQLSMGMSQDYVVAVEEGATLIRVGRAIFGS